jgi:glycosyltransferase involved in cell wall biosynthesis
MSAHEAMECGVATVVSRSCGLARLLGGDEALRVHAPSVADLVDAFKGLSDDARRSTVAAAGAEWARRRTWEQVGADIEAVLAEYVITR